MCSNFARFQIPFVKLGRTFCRTLNTNTEIMNVFVRDMACSIQLFAAINSVATMIVDDGDNCPFLNRAHPISEQRQIRVLVKHGLCLNLELLADLQKIINLLAPVKEQHLSPRIQIACMEQNCPCVSLRRADCK